MSSGDAPQQWLYALIAATLPAPTVHLPRGLVHTGSSTGRLVAWGRSPDGLWYPAVCWRIARADVYIVGTWWAYPGEIGAHPGRDYSRVPRLALDGPEESWPPIPPLHPDTGLPWLGRHEHYARKPPLHVQR